MSAQPNSTNFRPHLNDEAASKPTGHKEVKLSDMAEGTVVKSDDIAWPSAADHRPSKWAKYESLEVGQAAVNLKKQTANTIATRLRKHMGFKITVAKLDDLNYAIKRTE